jgi:SAM-dependent methyltransferase
VKDAALRTLARLGLLRPAYQGWERIRAIGSAEAVPDDGLPLPPRPLRVRVAGTKDGDWFLRGGELAGDSIRAALDRAGASIDRMDAVLDFGCGCGRVVRRWADLPGRVVGTDLSSDAIAWSRRNLPFATFEVNGLEPPLLFDGESFDLVYAMSVITHLPVDLQLRWLEELRRVLRPGGYLLITLHGDAYLDRLTPEEAARFRAGECVVRWSEVAGSNLCTTFHPASFLHGPLSDGFEIVEIVPRGALGNPEQDLVLLRKPLERGSTSAS